MDKYTINKDELIAHLSDQINFLIASAISFDNEFDGESKRMAAVIRILLHDTTHSSALLAQLNKMNILFYDSAKEFDPKNRLTENCLTMIRLSKKEGEASMRGDYVAPLDNRASIEKPEKLIGFNRWWNQNIVLRDKDKNTFKRKDLILTVANKEGGTHIDPKLDEAYANLTRFNSLAWKIYAKDEKKDMGNPIPPSIRQIAYEMIKTLKEGVIDLFPDKNKFLLRFEEYEKHCLQYDIQRGLKQEAPHA